MADIVEPIQVHNRYTGRIETEPVYGEKWLRWTYETGPGRVTLGLLVNKLWFSRFYGWRMSTKGSRRRIAPFIENYNVDAAEFAESPEDFKSFNDFFSRRLKPSARPICERADAIVFSADGRHLGFQNLGATERFYAKGQRLNLAALLGDDALARTHAGGSLVISRLCPVDYHRFHFSCSGTVGNPRKIDGLLYSVSPIALRRNLGYLMENKRVVTVIDDTAVGRVIVIEIGATCVGTIVQSHVPGRVSRGQEKGYFRFGGSCVVTVFEPGRVRLADDLVAQSREGRELFARMGDEMATVA